MTSVLTWTCCFAALSLRAIEAARSPIIMAIACVGVDGMRGATDASATLNPATPCTLQGKSNRACEKQHRNVGARTRSHARAHATFPGSAWFEIHLQNITLSCVLYDVYIWRALPFTGGEAPPPNGVPKNVAN